MTYRIETTAQAEADIERIYAWLSGRSVAGANRWYGSFSQAVERLNTNPLACALARENNDFAQEIRNLLFGTPRGRIYRALFIIEGDCVRVLAVGGPGEKAVKPTDVEI